MEVGAWMGVSFDDGTEEDSIGSSSVALDTMPCIRI